MDRSSGELFSLVSASAVITRARCVYAMIMSQVLIPNSCGRYIHPPALRTTPFFCASLYYFYGSFLPTSFPVAASVFNILCRDVSISWLFTLLLHMNTTTAWCMYVTRGLPPVPAGDVSVAITVFEQSFPMYPLLVLPFERTTCVAENISFQEYRHISCG